MMATPLLYILPSGELSGTERMAIRTLQHLADSFDGVIVAPPGPVHAHASQCGLRSESFRSSAGLARLLWRAARREPELAVASLDLSQAFLVVLAQALGRARVRHLHIVRGGSDERLSYGYKRLLQPFPVAFVAVSDFVRERLVAHGVDAARISVVENFIEPSAVAWRPVFREAGVRRVLMLSRLDRIKRAGLLLQAVRSHPALGAMQFDLYGSGEQEAELRAAAAGLPNVTLHGFRADAAGQLRSSDLLVHTCAEEPFGLVVLEAFAAGVPVLVPNAGGAGGLVRHGETGFHYAANDPDALADALQALQSAPAALLNAVVANARAELSDRFHPARLAQRYRDLLQPRG
ncbi:MULTISPECIES: glycosyltransferase family 4 protein [Cupriavidus]|nr:MULTISPECIES: glycosyltransferase family 4 protein [Cupriavidus]